MAIKPIAPPKGAVKNKKILGRGNASRGNTSGKGNKGQNARAGGGVAPGFEGGQMPLYRRLPRRGFTNADFKVTFDPINLSSLEKAFSDGDEVTLETLKAKKLIKNKTLNVKILGVGDLTKKLKVSIEKVSDAAAEKIKSAGGSVIEKSQD